MRISTHLLGSFLFSIVFFSLLTGCDPIPRRTLTAEEKTADMEWIYSQFNEYYAPLNYKEKRYNFDYEKMKKEYIERAVATRSNGEFYDLMFQFVANFKDAHTSASLTASSLPGRAKVAYLGFTGKRKGDVLLVTELLPTINLSVSKYPIKVGDKIEKLDGKTLPEVIKSEMLVYRDLGQEESNLTFHMNRVFNRLSILNGLPSKQDAVLLVTNDNEPGKSREVTLPWIVKDSVDFNNEQGAAKNNRSSTAGDVQDFARDILKIDNGQGNTPTLLAFMGFDGKFQFPSLLNEKMTQKIKGLDFFLKTFFIPDNVGSWTVISNKNVNGNNFPGVNSALSDLKQERSVPSHVFYLSEAQTYPTYVTYEKLHTPDGESTGGVKGIATIYLDTFAPSSSEDDVVKEFSDTLETLEAQGVSDIIIDLINNGGGSLSLGMRLAQTLSNEKVTMPKMQFRLSETWLDNFEAASKSGSSDSERELARRVFDNLITEFKGENRLSSPISGEVLVPFLLEPHTDLKKKFNIVLLVNEMCASMCDIFTATLKDNQMATVIGAKTMGAGGNVVSHFQAPNSHLDLRQTESLVLRSNGTYVENNGVDPDVPMAVNEYSDTKYTEVREKAIEFLTEVHSAVNHMDLD